MQISCSDRMKGRYCVLRADPPTFRIRTLPVGTTVPVSFYAINQFIDQGKPNFGAYGIETLSAKQKFGQSEDYIRFVSSYLEPPIN